MSIAILTVDLGNSRCKLAAWRVDGRTLEKSAEMSCATRPGLGAEVERFAREAGHDAERVGISSVAAPDVEAELRAVLERTFGARVVRALDAGVINVTDAPERVGSDRLFAARGAFELVHGPAVVISVGTALTVDAVAVDGTHARFLGGAIAPGPQLLARALHEHTARLPLIEPRVGAHALGRDTEAALQAGVVVGLRGAARELALRIAAEAHFDDARWIVTGGAADLLMQPAPFLDVPLALERDLVLRGVLAALLVEPAA